MSPRESDASWPAGTGVPRSPWQSRGLRHAAAPLMLLLFALPAAHPLLRPALGPPSHLLWWVHVVPVAYLTYMYGGRGGLGSVLASGLVTFAGEATFGAGYGVPAAWTTVVALTVAVVGTDFLVAGFALWIRGAEGALKESERFYRDLFEERRWARWPGEGGTAFRELPGGRGDR